MNAPLRRVGLVLVVLFGLLFANLNFVQAYRADEYRTSDYNGRVQIAEYQRQRGVVVVGTDAQAAATSVETDGRLRFLRTYPYDELYAHAVGYKAVNLSATGLERYENEFLAGTSDKLFVDRLRDLFTGGQTPGGNVLTTLSRPAQETAFNELRNNSTGATKGAVVALDPRTGAVQAMVSVPSFDPNPLTTHDTRAALAAYEDLAADRDQPLKNRAVSESYPPGSVFKVVMTAAALQRPEYTPDTLVPAGPTFEPEQTTHVIRNAAPSICPQAEVTLANALTVSCNTAYARLAVELGAGAVREAAQSFGFGDTDLSVGRLGEAGIRVGLSDTGEMTRGDGQDDPPVVAMSGIGQASVRITPLQGALLAAAVANNGSQMRPYLVQQLQSPDLSSAYTASPEELRRPLSPEVAGQLRDMMVSAVEDGTGRNARIGGFVVGGKTGTAEHGDGEPEHGWFVGFVLRDGVPISAVAVLLESAGSGGSPEAARIAGQVMRAVIADQGGE